MLPRVKQAIKTSLNRVGWDLARCVPKSPERPFQVLPYLVTEELRKNANFFFLQIGAIDGGWRSAPRLSAAAQSEWPPCRAATQPVRAAQGQLCRPNWYRA